MSVINIRFFQKIFLFFVMIIGLYSAKDYNISYDEIEYRQQGFVVLNHIGEKFFSEKTKQIKKDKNLNYIPIEDYFVNDTNHFKIHHTVNAALEFLFHKNSSKLKILNFRHIINFLLSIILVVFIYKLLRTNFSRISSSLSVILFLLSPRIYGNFFFNPNDIMSMLSLVGSIYYICKILKKNKFSYYIFFSLIFAIAINIRYTNFYIYPLLIFAILYYSKFNILNFPIKKYLTHFVLTVLILYLITPGLWINPNPIGIFHSIFSQISFTSHDPKIMFIGSIIPSSQLPGYYVILWIIITTPLLVLVLFLIGLIIFILKSIKLFYLKNDYLIVYGILLFYFIFIPIVSYLIFKPQIFNGWRHFYFVYIGIIFFCTYAIEAIENNKTKIIRNSFIIFFVLNILNLLNWSIKNHPYQSLFFNSVSKKYASNFELDYWGLSNLEAINFLLNKEKGKIYVSQFNDRSRIDFTILVLDELDQNRIEANGKYSKYWISNINSGLNDKDYENLGYEIVHKIFVDNFVINRILIEK